jgi:hypothetical protein
MNRVAASPKGRVYLPKYNKVPYPKLRLYLSVLDQLRRNKKAKKEILHPNFANNYRNGRHKKLPCGEKHLYSPSTLHVSGKACLTTRWARLANKGNQGQSCCQKRLANPSSTCYIVHGESYTYCNNTFIYYGERLFSKSPIAKELSRQSKTGEPGSYSVRPALGFPRSAIYPEDLVEIKNI